MTTPIVIAVTLKNCKDGWLRVRSDDLLNLILSGPDREEVVGCIAPAIATIFKHYGHSVTVCEAQRACAFMNRSIYVDDAAQSIRHFVIEVAQAAT